jgi:ketosteroid isomerase-like protein
MRCTLHVSAFVMMMILPGTAFAQGRTAEGRPTPAQEKEILALYERLLIADAKRDTAALKQIFAPGYTFVPPRGDTVLTREQRLAGTAADTSTTRPTYTLRGCRTQVHGSTAVAHCRYGATIRLPTADADSTREFISTAVFIQQGKQWRLVATHPSLIRPR